MDRNPRAGLNYAQVRENKRNVSTIDIHASHHLSHAEALNAAEKLSCDLAEKFDIDHYWENEVIHFRRPGVHGRILVRNDELRIQAQLGFMLLLMKEAIEQEIVRYLEEHFGCRFS